jgi:hypothetical protein
VPDGKIPNFPQKLLFNTFVDPCGPAMILISHFYFTGNITGTERDPIEQSNWLRTHLPYIGPLAKSIQQIRNKLAHSAFLEGIMLKLFVKNLMEVYGKKTQGHRLVQVLVWDTEDIIEAINKREINIITVSEEEPKKAVNNKEEVKWVMSPSRDVSNLNKGEIYSLLDIKNDPEARQRLKGRTILVIEGNPDRKDKEFIFRSWSGSICYGSRLEDGKRIKLRNELLVVMMD